MLTFVFVCLFDVFLDMQIVFQVLALLGKMGVAGGYCFLYVFFTELFPTVVRNMGFSITSTAARISICVCPYILYFGKGFPSLPFVKKRMTEIKRENDTKPVVTLQMTLMHSSVRNQR